MERIENHDCGLSSEVVARLLTESQALRRIIGHCLINQTTTSAATSAAQNQPARQGHYRIDLTKLRFSSTVVLDFKCLNDILKAKL